MKKIKLLILGATLCLTLSACQVPFTDKQFTMPFLEKKPEEALLLMQKNMSELSNYKQEGEMNMVLSLPDFKKIIEDEYEKRTSKVDNEELDPALDGLVVREDLYFTSPVYMTFAAMIPRSIKMKDENTSFMAKDSSGNDSAEANDKITIDLGNMTYSGEFETRVIGDKSYVKIKSLPSIVEGVLGNSFMNAWVDMNQEDVADSLSQDGLIALPGLDEELKKQNEIREKMKTKMDELEKEFASSGVLLFNNRLADEKIDGVNCYHYQVSFDTKALDKAIDIGIDLVKESDDMVTDEQINEFKDVMTKVKNSIVTNSGDVWIGKKDLYLRKTAFDFKFNLADAISTDDFKITQEVGLELAFDFKLSEFDQAHSINVPDDAKTIKEIMESSPAYMSSKIRANDAARLADVKMMQTALELYYNDENTYPSSLSFEKENRGVFSSSSGAVYMTKLPLNPEYVGSSQCPVGFQYSYTVAKDLEGYDLEYCLEGSAGGISAGKHIATPAGIDTGNWQNVLSDIEEQESLTGQGAMIDSIDSDSDGLDDDLEKVFGTDPNNPDTDGDGYSDGSEVSNGYNPNGEGKIDIY